MNILKKLVRKFRRNEKNSNYSLPQVRNDPGYYNTIEGCLIWKAGHDADRAVREVFYSFPYEVRRRLEFAPQKPGEWVERARFWQQQLKPALPPKMYYSVIILILEWYIYRLKERKANRKDKVS